jgi:type IV fimbrial biogenesis protein FimT
MFPRAGSAGDAEMLMRAFGFTLTELLTSVTIGGILLGIAVPNFSDVVQDSRRVAVVNELLAELQAARGEALKRAQTVIVCPSLDGTECVHQAVGTQWDWSGGWLTLVNLEGSMTAPSVDPADLILRFTPNDHAGVRVKANQRGMAYRPFNTALSTPGTLTICDARSVTDATQARAIIVSATGRPRVSRKNPAGADLNCS